MKLETLRAIVHDALISLLFGAAVIAGLSVVLFVIGLLAGGFDFRAALVLVRGGLLITGAAELFVSAGLMLANKGSGKVRDYSQWTRHFQVFGLLPVLLLTSVMVLTAGSFVDYYLYF